MRRPDHWSERLSRSLLDFGNYCFRISSNGRVMTRLWVRLSVSRTNRPVLLFSPSGWHSYQSPANHTCQPLVFGCRPDWGSRDGGVVDGTKPFILHGKKYILNSKVTPTVRTPKMRPSTTNDANISISFSLCLGT